jgi:hypothetical protein
MDEVCGLWGRMEGVRWCILKICASVGGVRCTRKVIEGERKVTNRCGTGLEEEGGLSEP